jgi:putative SOS response-associated peptidase YedK
MCGRFAAQLPPEFIRRLFRTSGEPPDLAANWNLAPTQQALVVRLHPASGERRLDVLRWGLVPHFTRDPKTARRPVNARAEGAAASAMFGGALARRRCLVPADAYYEWKPEADGKQPYAVGRADGAPLALAGVWEGWRAPDGGVLRSFAILTIAATPTMAALHARMPVLIEQADWQEWLGPGAAGPFLRPAADGVLRTWKVGRAVNAVRNNGPELLRRIVPEEQ